MLFEELNNGRQNTQPKKQWLHKFLANEFYIQPNASDTTL